MVTTLHFHCSIRLISRRYRQVHVSHTPGDPTLTPTRGGRGFQKSTSGPPHCAANLAENLGEAQGKCSRRQKASSFFRTLKSIILQNTIYYLNTVCKFLKFDLGDLPLGSKKAARLCRLKRRALSFENLPASRGFPRKHGRMGSCGWTPPSPGPDLPRKSRGFRTFQIVTRPST